MGYGQDMRTSSRSGGPRAALALALLLCACSGESAESDAGAAARDAATRDATSPDVGPNDTGIVPDAGEPDAGHPPDAGPTPPGPCTCLHGAHLECGPGEVCLGGYEGDEATACVRREPRGGALAGACTSTGTPWSVEAPCSATCVPAEEVRVCAGRAGAVARHFDRWSLAIRRPLRAELETLDYCDRDATECWLDANDRAQVSGNASLSEECIRSTAATVLGIVELCAGHDVIRSGPETSPFDVRVAVVEECRARSVGTCLRFAELMLDDDTRTLVDERELATRLQMACPDGRPQSTCASTSSIAEATCILDVLRRVGFAYGE
jgi:hypothetical protein